LSATNETGTAIRSFPVQPLLSLDALWIQLAGSRCNLTCTHCFVSCGPEQNRHATMSRAEVAARVAEGLALGVREVYFTGGEPFLHRDLLAILGDTLAVAPATVLTNGTLLAERTVAALRALSDAARFTLEIRVSFDGEDAATHDAIRGTGTFARALDGLTRLAEAGLLPIATVTQLEPEDEAGFRERWITRLAAAGIARPRLKVLPLFRLGREVERSRGFLAVESLAGLTEAAFDPAKLPCATCRAVTSRGVFVCPLLVDEPAARMSERVADAARPFALRHGACFTCWTTGATCAN